MHSDESTEPRYLIGYARVSTGDQNLAMQIDALTAYGVPVGCIYTDKATGAHMRRRGWDALKKDVRRGGVVVVREINRLGRDITDLFSTLRWLHEKGADLVVLAMELDTRTPTGRLIFGILGLVSQWERELIVERTKAGQAAARARGRVPGAKPKLAPEVERDLVRRAKAGEQVRALAREYGVSKSKVYLMLKGKKR